MGSSRKSAYYGADAGQRHGFRSQASGTRHQAPGISRALGAEHAVQALLMPVACCLLPVACPMRPVAGGLSVVAVLAIVAVAAAQGRPRARDLGIAPGAGAPG